MKGYFRRRGCICKKKKCTCGAKWSFTLDIGIDPGTGKRKQKTVSGFQTKDEAEKACAEMITEYERGNLSVAAKSETVQSFMHGYIQNVLKNEIEGHTLEQKIAIMDKYIVPYLGRIKLQKLTPMQVQEFITELIGMELSAGTIHNILRVLNQTLNKATEWGYVVKNVASLATKPSYKPRKFEVWTKEQFSHFLQVNKDSRFYPFYLIALTAGLRPGEITALTWDMLNTRKNTIRIERTVSWSKEKGAFLKETPKNDSSRRTVTVPASVMSYMKALKLSQEPNEMNLVIPGVKAPLVYNSVVNQVFVKDVKKAGIPKIRLHDLRHTHATYLLSPPPFGLGQSIKAVSERLGHAKTMTTLNTYAHVLPDMQESLADRIEESIGSFL